MSSRPLSRRAVVLAALGAAAGGLAGCVPATMRPTIAGPAELRSGDLVVVGRVDLTPGLKNEEQSISDTWKEYRNAMLLLAGDQPENIQHFERAVMRDCIRAPLGEVFFASGPVRPFFINAGCVILQANLKPHSPAALDDVMRRSQVLLRAPLRIDVRPGDRAVYIGDIEYVRDEFFGLSRLVVRDRYPVAQAAYQKKFGDGAVLRKSLAVLTRPPTA